MATSIRLIRLPADIEKRFDALARMTGRTKAVADHSEALVPRAKVVFLEADCSLFCRSPLRCYT